MYIVAINRPYYPSVNFEDELDNAKALYEEIIKENNEEDGAYASTVVLAKIMDLKNIKTHY